MDKNIIEIWRAVRGYEGLYEVSNLGRVRSLNYHRTGEVKIKEPQSNEKGYKHLILFKDGKLKNFYIHRLVAQAFLPNPENLPQVNHINENKGDNRVENLEWCTNQYNSDYSFSKPVNQYTLDGILVREWPSLMKIERCTGWSHGNISMCLNGKRNTAYGFIWKYV